MAIHGCFDPRKLINGCRMSHIAKRNFSQRTSVGRKVRQALKRSQSGPVIKIIEKGKKIE